MFTNIDSIQANCKRWAVVLHEILAKMYHKYNFSNMLYYSGFKPIYLLKRMQLDKRNNYLDKESFEVRISEI